MIQPEVSVITTTLNCESFLVEAVDSVLGQQTEIDWELLLIDDGSEDRSFDIARNYARRFPGRIFFHQHPGGGNCGISASRNLGLRHARAPLTAFLDADDVWLPDKLQLQVGAMYAHPQVAMTYASAERWYDYPGSRALRTDKASRNHVPPLIPSGIHDGVIEAPTLLEWYLVDESMTPCTCTVLVRTDVARGVGGFVDSFTGLYDDQVFYAKIALREKILVDSRCVARYRQHARSCCALGENNTDGWRGRRVFLAWLDRYTRNFGRLDAKTRLRLRSSLAAEREQARDSGLLNTAGLPDRTAALACLSESAS